MPIYEYECDQCHSRFEIRKSIFEATRSVSCPFCQKNKTHRCWSVPNIRTKEHKEQASASKEREVRQANATGINIISENNGGAGIYIENTVLRAKNIRLKGNRGGGIVAKYSIVEVEKDHLKIE